MANILDIKLLEKPLESIYLGLENIESKTGKLLIDVPVEHVESSVNVFRPGNILFGKLRPYLAKVAHPDFDGVCTTEILVIDPKSGLINRFLFYIVLSDGFIKSVDAMTYGTRMPRVNKDQIGNMVITLPPLPEQQAIAAYLDGETARLDALADRYRRLLALLDEKRRALITHAVTRGLNPAAPLKDSGIEWLGDIPAHWEVWKISHAYRLIGSGTTPPSDNPEWYDGDVLWVTTSELREKVIFDTEKKVTNAALKQFSSLRIFPANSLLIAMYGATIGRVGLLGTEACTNQACCILAQSCVINYNFAFYCFQAIRDHIVSLSFGGGQPNINQEKIRSLKVAIPPSMNEQQAIAAYLDRETARLDDLKAKIETLLARLGEYRAALISAAVTGKMDVHRPAG